MKIKIKKCIGLAAAAMLLGLAACTDEIKLYQDQGQGAEGAYGYSRAGEQSITQLEDAAAPGNGNTTGFVWQTNDCRVALVGPGRVVSMTGEGGLLEVGSGGNSVEAAVDDNLNNYVTTTVATVGANAYAPIIGIKDLHHVYKGGQTVGFMLHQEAGTTVLSLGVAKGLTIRTKLKGETQEEKVFGNMINSGLKLDLLAIGTSDGSDQEIKITTEKPFDEVQLFLFGINADVLAIKNAPFAVKYAFVGDYPEIRATSETATTSGHIGGIIDEFWNVGDPTVDPNVARTNGFFSNKGRVVDDELTNYAVMANVSVLTSLTGGAFLTVDFKRDVPAGYEVGYVYSYGNVLDVSLLSTKKPQLTAYDASNKSVGDQTGVGGLSVLSVGVASGEAKGITSMVLENDCRKLRIHWVPTVLGELLKVGSVQLFYAYVREPVKVQAFNEFAIDNDTTYFSTYLLPPNDFVTYSLDPEFSQPGVTVDGTKVTGLAGNGVDYHFIATYTSPNNKLDADEKTVTQKFLIRKLEVSNTGISCNTYFKYDDIYGSTLADFGNESGSAGSVTNPQNVLGRDGEPHDKDKCGEINSVIGIGANGILAAVEFTNPIVATEELRIGFEVQPDVQLLDLTLVDLFRIYAYNGANEVTHGLDLSSVSLGLLNFPSDKSRQRFSIKVPKGSTISRIELRSVRVLTLLSKIEVYNAFMEPTSCYNSMENCTDIMSDFTHGLEIDYDNMAKGTVLGALNTGFLDLGNAIDQSLETYAQYRGLNVGSGALLPLKFNTLMANQPIGIILTAENGDLLELSALSGITLTAKYNETEVLSKTNFNTADADLIYAAETKKTFLEIVPPSPYNRLEITFAGVAETTHFRLYGVYTMVDLDGDGTFDCVDDAITMSEIHGLKLSTPDICADNEERYHAGSITGVMFTTEGAPTSNETWYMKFTKVGGGSTIFTVTIQPNQSIVFYTGGSAEEEARINEFFCSPGEYTVAICQDYNFHDTETTPVYTYSFDDALFRIHPVRSTWRGTTSKKWDVWSNWDNGIPWTCTNVILPTPQKLANIGSLGYPELEQGETYYCYSIHFEEGAMLKGQNRLKCGWDALVDMSLAPNKYQLVSAPLNGMLTGDMFVLENPSSWPLDGAFTNDEPPMWNYSNYLTTYFPADGIVEEVTNGGTTTKVYPEHRVNPIIYQRFWSRAVSNTTLSRAEATGAELTALRTDWSRTFNAVKTRYTRGQGFAMMAYRETGAPEKYSFHFPKSHSQYNYYDFSGNKYNDMNESVRGSYNTRAASSLMVSYGGFPATITLERIDGGDIFCFGNPFMCNIDIAALIAGNNGNIVTVYKLNDEDTGYHSVTDGVIPPMTAVMLKVNTSGTTYGVKLASSMLNNSPLPEASNAKPGMTKVTAIAGGVATACYVEVNRKASDGYKEREDAQLLMCSEQSTPALVYTVADGVALCSQSVSGRSEIPVGLMLEKEGVDVALSLSGSGWTLVDTATGAAGSSITVREARSSEGRIVLRRE